VGRNYELKPVAPEDAAYVRSLVIHEDAALLAFAKPAGLPVQTRNPDDRTLDALLAAFARSNGKRPRLVHRLDAQTSGVIVAAKTQPAAAALSAAFAGRDMRKVYLAVVTGAAPGDGGVIETALARYRPKPELELMRAARPGDAEAQAAVTRWRRVASNGLAHLLEVEPQTGRMHQIRAHLSLAGLPIVGDPYYGGAATVAGVKVPRMMLHAEKLSGPHPSGGTFTLFARAPDEFRAFAPQLAPDMALRPKAH
jgi:23S rRNA pseudouridine955/2504/2580 synthase